MKSPDTTPPTLELDGLPIEERVQRLEHMCNALLTAHHLAYAAVAPTTTWLDTTVAKINRGEL